MLWKIERGNDPLRNITCPRMSGLQRAVVAAPAPPPGIRALLSARLMAVLAGARDATAPDCTYMLVRELACIT